MGERVTGRRDRPDLGVAEHDHLVVGERVMGELDAGALGEVRGRAGAPTSSGSPET